VYQSGEREYRAAFFPRLKFARCALPSRSGIPDAANHRVDISIYIFDSRIARESWTFIGSTLIAERARVTSRLNRKKIERERERFLPLFGVLHFQQFRAHAAAQQSVISAAEVLAFLSSDIHLRSRALAARCG